MPYFTPGNSSAEEIIATYKKPIGTVIRKIKSEYPQSHIRIEKEIPSPCDEKKIAKNRFDLPTEEKGTSKRGIIKNTLLLLVLYLFAISVTQPCAPDYISKFFESAMVAVSGISENVSALALNEKINLDITKMWGVNTDFVEFNAVESVGEMVNDDAVPETANAAFSEGKNDTYNEIMETSAPYIIKYIPNIEGTSGIAESEPLKPVIAEEENNSFAAIKKDLSRSSDKIYLQNETRLSPDVNAMAVSAYPIEAISESSEPQVLILHTHGTESYSDSSTGVSRSTDTEENVVRVGAELARVLRFYGIPTIHSKTMHDKDSYITSYQSSKNEAQKILEQNPSIKYVIDLHRDALPNENGCSVKTYTEIDGNGAAQIMFVIGTNAGGGNHPNYEKNLTVAAHIQNGIMKMYPGLARPINLRSAIFNQNVCSGSLLLEVGSDANTLDEAICAVKYFGEAFARVIMEKN